MYIQGAQIEADKKSVIFSGPFGTLAMELPGASAGVPGHIKQLIEELLMIFASQQPQHLQNAGNNTGANSKITLTATAAVTSSPLHASFNHQQQQQHQRYVEIWRMFCALFDKCGMCRVVQCRVSCLLCSVIVWCTEVIVCY